MAHAQPTPPLPDDIGRPPGDFWIFAYGSLIWKPDFPFVEQAFATVHGYHRGLCIRSEVYRGSPRTPGVVFGLDRGGACRGMAFRIAEEDAGDVTRQLWAREMVTGVYQPRWLRAALGESRTMVWGFVADRRHDQYLGRLSDREIVGLIRQGRGQAGPCLDYVANTLQHLERLGIPDRRLARITKLAAAG